MATIGGTRALYTAQRRFKDELNDLFKDLTQRAGGVLLRAERSDGTIDPQNMGALTYQIGQLVQATFVGPDGRTAYRNETQPISPFAALLNRWIGYVAFTVLDAHATFMRRVLPDDLQAWLMTNTTLEAVSESSNPLAQYEAAHTWVDASGYTLSQRIWRVEMATRMRIDALLTDGIRNGTSARALAAQLEQFLLPNRAALRTKKPYGSDASYDAMRLARTEISRAHAQASKAAAIANPFVSGLDFCLSARHPKADICDKLATIGMAGERLKDPYLPESAPLPCVDTHPQCLCNTRPFVKIDRVEREKVIVDLREQMRRGEPAPMMPFNWRRMLMRMLGAYLVQEIIQQFAA